MAAFGPTANSRRCSDMTAVGGILLKKDFQGDPRVILIQDEHPTSKIDSKIPPLGFDYFKFLFHSLILDTFSTVSVEHRTVSGRDG
jgi:hypothetical protein